MNTTITIASIVERFLDAARLDQTLSGESIVQYRSSIQHFVRTMGDLVVSDITVDTFRELKGRLVERGVGPAFTNGVIHAMKGLLEFCKGQGLAVMDVSLVKTLPIPRRAVGYLTQDESEQFVAAIRLHNRMGEVNLPGLCFRALV